MGKHFGELGVFVRGIISYKLSPHEQKPFAKCITFGIPNFVTRASSSVLTWLPTFVCGYLFYRYIEYDHALRGRKNPADYASEVEPNPPPKNCRRSDVPVDKCKKKEEPEDYCD